MGSVLILGLKTNRQIDCLQSRIERCAPSVELLPHQFWGLIRQEGWLREGLNNHKRRYPNPRKSSSHVIYQSLAEKYGAEVLKCIALSKDLRVYWRLVVFSPLRHGNQYLCKCYMHPQKPPAQWNWPNTHCSETSKSFVSLAPIDLFVPPPQVHERNLPWFSRLAVVYSLHLRWSQTYSERFHPPWRLNDVLLS